MRNADGFGGHAAVWAAIAAIDVVLRPAVRSSPAVITVIKDGGAVLLKRSSYGIPGAGSAGSAAAEVQVSGMRCPRRRAPVELGQGVSVLLP